MRSAAAMRTVRCSAANLHGSAGRRARRRLLSSRTGGDMAGIRERFGRPLRLGIIGGGPESWIGVMHRTAAELDGAWRGAAGVSSRGPARSRAVVPAMGFDVARSYGDLSEMLERERQRPDPIDGVAIMSPNDKQH